LKFIAGVSLSPDSNEGFPGIHRQKIFVRSGDREPFMKQCPFCAEEIQQEAVKCRFCGEFVVDAELRQMREDTGKWYHRTPMVVISVLCFGPLALPLVWFNPNYGAVTKVLVTVLVVALTVGLGVTMIGLYAHLLEQIERTGL
jgi:hypothetical protein